MTRMIFIIYDWIFIRTKNQKMRSALCEWHLKQLDLGFGDIAWWLDRSQSLFYFVPQESHRQAGSSTSGCKIPALGKSLGPRGMSFLIHPSSLQCTDTIPNISCIDNSLYSFCGGNF